jgi:hypothetical protein
LDPSGGLDPPTGGGLLVLFFFEGGFPTGGGRLTPFFEGGFPVGGGLFTVGFFAAISANEVYSPNSSSGTANTIDASNSSLIGSPKSRKTFEIAARDSKRRRLFIWNLKRNRAASCKDSCVDMPQLLSGTRQTV